MAARKAVGKAAKKMVKGGEKGVASSVKLYIPAQKATTATLGRTLGQVI